MDDSFALHPSTGSSLEKLPSNNSVDMIHQGQGLTITIGICCMRKKSESKEMCEILTRLGSSGLFTIVRFSEEMILSDPPAQWPMVDCCIPFFSSGFPLDKAIEYAKLHPDTFFLTEPASQRGLLDRRTVYTGLHRNNIPTVHYVFCSRDGPPTSPLPVVEESLDSITIDGVTLQKPFVEKPVNSEDHNIRIYYHSSEGGGSTHLFRKIGNKSSEFFPDVSTIRREGSYIYEEFVKTANVADIKCYTVGQRFQYAEARRSPVYDGLVERDAKGKEKRVRIELTPAEKIMAMKIVKTFRQKVCGFDILRNDAGISYICDVNGWSFVKGNTDYCEKATEIIKNMFLQEVQRRGLHRLVLDVSPQAREFIKQHNGDRNLVGVVCVFRHADRTPKQKCKIKITNPEIISVGFPADKADQKTEAVWKGGHPMLKSILAKSEALLAGGNLSPKDAEKLSLAVDVLGQQREGLKIQLKPQAWDEVTGRCTEAQMVCKWGGWITEQGKQQAMNLGNEFCDRVFRNEPGMYTKDMAVFSNNERRVINTAEFFSKALLKSEKIPGGVRVREDLLGDSEPAKSLCNEMKARIHHILHTRTEEETLPYMTIPGVFEICDLVGLVSRTPYGAMHHTLSLIQGITSVIHNGLQLAREESVALFRQRWEILEKSFYNAEKDLFDCTKIPDIFDAINYDVCYNQVALAPLDLFPIFEAAEALASFVTDAEYGITIEDKVTIGSLVASPLLRQISEDINEIITNHHRQKCKMYFTSESHLHTLKNCLYFGSEQAKFHPLFEPLDLHYLTHFVFKVYNYPLGLPPKPPKQGSSEESITPNFLKVPFRQDSISTPVTPRAAALGGTPSNISHIARTRGTTTPEPAIIRDLHHQIEVQFSGGVDKNMFGIVQDHHADYAAVTPMIRIHNNLRQEVFLELVRNIESLNSSRELST